MELTTVHQALSEAATEPVEDTTHKPMSTFTFRIHRETVAEAKSICEAHGTTLVEYLRKCIELLPRDYKP